MKILKANPEIPSMTMEEAERFLESKLNLQLATIDSKGDPNIQPVWFYYDKNKEKLFIMTGKNTKKSQNVRESPIIYFCIEDGNSPYKGVKGKGIVTIYDNLQTVVSLSNKMIIKYLGTLDNPMSKAISERSKSGEGIIIEITPKFFSTWDFDKMSIS
ncbi:pyridoxamine 5'-phosphate oxidase family protein [Candidatus Nitrosocosmicus agrestis]|jgi:general stress protein 26|uniref:pyridoxamine 5'-phosphate oxidase family protein n=1 Tax=Candidatus Nitrosocosmicus agrestis TaxID=2563600 RepID=UPI00122E9513|nr:pyridoxamine 5'-phosphate oxidase family protein [Candidatus Nitrosocosmicus sp. SS]KAA2280475.1 pyridoxamine 5'-phosphate oxidase family protein [Candidatus Nitrosocosmicus sp. SS]KAF0869254.1 pyridoxamine 5'-phosphate oxidase family protein [Candidatus Nitrosocosmicus sp. SS]